MTTAGSDEQALRRQAVREILEDQPVVMAGDVAAEIDVSRKTARRYLDDLETSVTAVESREASGGRIWYVESARADGGVPPVGELELHLRGLWSDTAAGRALVSGLGLALAVAVLSTVSLAAATAGWSAVHGRTHTLVRLLSVLAWPLLVGPSLVLWRKNKLRP